MTTHLNDLDLDDWIDAWKTMVELKALRKEIRAMNKMIGPVRINQEQLRIHIRKLNKILKNGGLTSTEKE